MRSSRPKRLQILITGVAILLITALHMLTPLDLIVLHEIYQRLYYIPIIAAASVFGLRWGLLASAFATIAYIPHITLQWQHFHPDYALNQYAEIFLFNIVGGVTGVLGDRNRRARERSDRTAIELQKAYAELRQTFEQLLQAERLAALGELSAAVVHEVRNPLGSIKGAVEIIGDALPSDSSRREFAEIASREVERLDRLVTEFLRFARPPEPATAPANIKEIVQSVASLIEQSAASQNVRINCKFDNDLPLVTVDSEQIKQVLLNLAINSLQVMPDGGSLQFRAARAVETVMIEVEDEGGGIDPAIAARIFDPFFTTKDKGIGLGLSTAYKIATQHGGELSTTNGKQGAIFRLTLPLTQRQAKAAIEFSQQGSL
ncbi:MAG TPA: ATP-binding protein [Pyrinomonadaceae bacterium]|nr:ATP-binding protein [Pyrinomonadaceae bacterium]